MFVYQFIENPNGKETKGIGEPRGQVKLTQFVDIRGHRKSAECHEVRRKMDIEAFTVHMHNCRRWPKDKSEDIFNAYKDDKEHMSVDENFDFNGPKESPLRIRFPSWMTCSDYDDDVTVKYQDRSVHSLSKAEILPDTHRSNMLGELDLGFQPLKMTQPSKISLQTTASSCTHYGGSVKVSAGQMLKEAMQESLNAQAQPEVSELAASHAQGAARPGDTPAKSVDFGSVVDNAAASF